MAYTDKHRGFIQAMLARNSVTAEEAMELYLGCCNVAKEDAVNDPAAMKACIATINSRIKFQELEIKERTCEVTGQLHYCLVFTNMDNPLARCHEAYTPEVLGVYKTIVHKVVDSYYGADPKQVTSTDVVNMISQQEKSMSKVDIDAAVQELIQDKWLLQDEDGLHLSVLTLAEMEPYLKWCYEEQLASCALCKFIVVRGDECQSCDARVHFHCVRKYEATYKKQLDCPSCRRPWKAATMNEDSSD